MAKPTNWLGCWRSSLQAVDVLHCAWTEVQPSANFSIERPWLVALKLLVLVGLDERRLSVFRLNLWEWMKVRKLSS